MKKTTTRSIFSRNFGTTMIVLVISFALLGVAFTAVINQYIIGKQTETMRDDARRASRMLSAYVTEWGAGGLEVRAATSLFSDTSGFHVLVANGDGCVVSCSDKEVTCRHIGTQLPEYVMQTLSRDGEFFGKTTLDGIYGMTRHTVVTPIISQRGMEKPFGYVILSAAPEDLSQMGTQFAGIFFMVSPIVILLAMVFTYVTTKRLTDPIKRMAQATHRFGHGDFSVRVEDEGSSYEITELADSFNVMADSLERSEQRRRDLIANVAHELKTPMTTITGFADGILDGTIPREKEDDYLKVISSETKRLNRLVRGMLEMSRVQDRNTEDVLAHGFDVTEVIRRAILSLEGKITDRGLDVDIALPEEAVWVRGDADSITQVAYNLIDNAAKFAVSGSTIKIGVWKKDAKVHVSVENRGETIAKDDLPFIFDRFHKADKSRSKNVDGVGLGLYIVKMIIDRHNEDIFVTSADGVTKFEFTLTMKS